MARDRKMIMLAAHVPEDSELHKAVMKEQAETGQPVAGIIRAALTDRYAKRLRVNGRECDDTDC